MNKPILKIENLSKQYRLGVVGTGTISHDLNRWWHTVRGKEDPYLKIGESNDRATKGESKYVWALKDINIEVQEGEVLGIIGKNGAGKSTLLKILSRVTGPTTGSIKSRGRIASLLEVGTGFHPELTGKENIFLNGAILGMTKAEINAKLDEIVDFSGVARYLDTPVKRYSSGMKVRLAFAVAAHLEPDILVVDEVLAVGDAEFQKKAIGKMQDISKGDGRTVLFVSHNMAAVKSLCTRGVVLRDGMSVFEGRVSNAVQFYLGTDKNNIKNKISIGYIKNDIIQFKEIEIINRPDNGSRIIEEHKEIEIRISFKLNTITPERYHITYHLLNGEGESLFSFSSNPKENTFCIGENDLSCFLPKNFLQAGNFALHMFFVEDRKKAILIERDIIHFSVINSSREIGVYMGKEPGYIRPKFKWINYTH